MGVHCAAQYKSKLPFYHLSNACDKVAMERCYFGSRHGKGACDACGGVIKIAVDDDIRTGECIVQNAASMYQHCCENFILPTPNDHPAGCCHTKRSFKLVTTSQIDRSISSSSVMTVPGTRQLHSLKGMGNNTLTTRRLACFCHPGLQDNPEECLNKKFVNRRGCRGQKYSEDRTTTKRCVLRAASRRDEAMQDISRVGTCCCQWSIVDVSVTCLTVAHCCRCVWYHRQWCFEHKTRERACNPVPSSDWC